MSKFLSFTADALPSLDAGGDQLLSDVITIAYPVADIVCATVAVIALLRARHGGGVRVLTLAIFLGSPIASAVTDPGYAFFALSGKLSRVHPAYVPSI